MPKRPREYKQWMKDPNPKEPKQTKHSRHKRQRKIAEQGQDATICPQIEAEIVNIGCTSAENIHSLEKTSTCDEKNNEELILNEETDIDNSTFNINEFPQSYSLFENIWNEDQNETHILINTKPTDTSCIPIPTATGRMTGL